jgi:6-phosphofructo-2-kinase
VIALVGLPARGKSFVGRKLLHYLNWTGCKCQIFNVGRYRREAYAMLQQEQQQQQQERERSEAAAEAAEAALAADPDGSSSTANANANNGSCDANFFDANNQQASELREKVAEMALLDMLRWLDEEDDDDNNTTANPHHHNHQSTSNLSESGSTAAGGGGGATAANLDSTRHSTSSLGAPPKFSWKRYERVAIFDATNSTDKRRRWILEMCTAPERRKGKPTGVVFVESLCDDKELLDENYRYKVSVSPDYAGVPEEEALTDLRERVRKYEEQYETIADDSMSYIKVFNLSTKLLCNHIYGRMAKELVPALMAWHIGTRPVFLCRPGQTLSGIYTDGEDYVSRAKIDVKDPRFLDMSTNTRKKSFRGDSLGPTGKLFKHALLDLCYEEAHSFMFKRASVRDMAYTGTSLTGLAPLESIVPSFESLDSQHDHREPFPLRIMTSTMPRAIDTVNWEEFDFHIHQVSNLNPLDKGDFAGMELEDIRKVNPAWYHKLEQDPFDTRYVVKGGSISRRATDSWFLLLTLYALLSFLAASPAASRTET